MIQFMKSHHNITEKSTSSHPSKGDENLPLSKYKHFKIYMTFCDCPTYNVVNLQLHATLENISVPVKRHPKMVEFGLDEKG